MYRSVKHANEKMPGIGQRGERTPSDYLAMGAVNLSQRLKTQGHALLHV